MTIYAEYAHTRTLYVANNVYRETYTSKTKKGFLFIFALQVTDITRYEWDGGNLKGPRFQQGIWNCKVAEKGLFWRGTFVYY